ncbi:putative monovalent cation/H+ antiporter subunit A [Bellilinea sp.]|uniref:putative monovalent cation/H+ antiporter subunit A n=1 Tax=Bellilinea sp. TaxID=2838785 RepID=UPI002ADD95EB|nr:putative monovalent cation/H+ antiporter subunit A [Bellilinea sp.]
MDIVLPTAVLLLLILSALAPFIQQAQSQRAGWLMAILPAGLFLTLLGRLPAILAGQVFAYQLPWAERLGVTFSLYLDGLGLLFSLLILGIGTLVLIYGGGYLHGHHQLGRFYAFILFFMAAMFGVVISDNALTLFVFWELTSISSFLLIGFDHEKEASRYAALQALLVTGGGGLAMLAGLVLLGQIGGSYEISQLNQLGDVLRNSPLFLPAFLLILAGALTKSAQYPFHFWLPGAMAAPTPVSAYLHSATMVKAGVYLLARLSPIFAGTAEWQMLVTGFGLATFLAGALLAIGQVDLKKLLAYTTVASLGTMVMLLGWGSDLAVKAAMLYLLAHALYKGALFLVAGAVDHETGSRDVSKLSGLRRSMPRTALAGGLAALSMAGLPPALGFIAKEVLYETTLAAQPLAGWLTAGALIGNAILVAVSGLVGLKPFIGKPGETPRHAHAAPLSLDLPPLLLASLGLLAGLLPMTLAAPLVQASAQAALLQPLKVKLALWHGLNPMLALSALTLALGAALYAGWRPVWELTARLRWLGRFGPAHAYQVGLENLRRFASWLTYRLQNGYLRFYLMTIILTTVALAGLAYLRGANEIILRNDWGTINFYEIVLGALIILAALTIIRTRSRLATIAIMGIVGYGLALIYLLYGAPDLAMIQFAIETLTVILFVLVVYRLPKFTRLTSPPARLADFLVAMTGGLLMTILTLIVTARPVVPHISEFFMQNALRLANGRNVVNVILVDFRAFDTLGEITVLALAGIGVYALIRLTIGRHEIIIPPAEEED